MKAMILAAGRGERMRPLTDTTPKPLLRAGPRSLIEHHLLQLKDNGFTDIIINTAWLSEKLHHALGDGSQYGVSIQYSDEKEALETAGGIKKALPLLGSDPFLVINGDIWCDYPYRDLKTRPGELLAHLVLVDNPAHNDKGDFGIDKGLLSNQPSLTFSGIGIYQPAFFDFTEARYPLAPLLRQGADNHSISAEQYRGNWIDIGTPERLKRLEEILAR